MHRNDTDIENNDEDSRYEKGAKPNKLVMIAAAFVVFMVIVDIVIVIMIL